MTILRSLTSPIAKSLGGSLLRTNRQWVNGIIFGSSNIGATAWDDSSVFTNQFDNFIAGKHCKLDHTDTLQTFSTPINNNNSTTYNFVNEDMMYGVGEGLVIGVGAATSKKVAIVPAVESATPVSAIAASWLDGRNASDPFALTRRYGQVITRARNLMIATGETLDFAYFPDAGRDAANGYLADNVYTAYLNGIDNFRSDLGLGNIPILVPNLGATPASGYPTWDAIKAKLTADLEANTTNVFLIEPEGLGISLTSGIQHEWPLSVGESGTWVVGETLTGSTSGNSGIVSNYNLGQNVVWTENYVNFTAGEVVTGGTSGVTGTLSNPLNPATVHYNTAALNTLAARAVTLLGY